MPPGYRRDIEGLRALAVLSVIAYHAFPAIAPGGFVGVDVFFVISGFLITGIIVREREAGDFSWGRFYLRRARRILPALAAVADPKLKLVVLAARWPLYRDAPPFYDVNSPRIGAALRGRVNDLAPSLVSTLDAIASRTRARVVIIGPTPELTVIPPECVALRRHLRLPEQVCWRVPSGPPLARARPAEAEIRRALAARPDARTVFPSQDLCDAQACVSAMDGRLIYFDDDHLSASGARRLVPGWLDQALSRP